MDLREKERREKERERELSLWISPSLVLQTVCCSTSYRRFFFTDSHTENILTQDITDDDDDDDGGGDSDGANDDDARLFLDFFSRCLAVSIASEKNYRRSPQLCQTKQQQKRVVLIDNHRRSLSSKDVLRDDQLRKNAARHCIYRSEQHLQRDDCKKWY
jgi:hypothetical protein